MLAYNQIYSQVKKSLIGKSGHKVVGQRAAQYSVSSATLVRKLLVRSIGPKVLTSHEVCTYFDLTLEVSSGLYQRAQNYNDNI